MSEKKNPKLEHTETNKPVDSEDSVENWAEKVNNGCLSFQICTQLLKYASHKPLANK